MALRTSRRARGSLLAEGARKQAASSGRPVTFQQLHDEGFVRSLAAGRKWVVKATGLIRSDGLLHPSSSSWAAPLLLILQTNLPNFLTRT